MEFNINNNNLLVTQPWAYTNQYKPLIQYSKMGKYVPQNDIIQLKLGKIKKLLGYTRLVHGKHSIKRNCH